MQEERTVEGFFSARDGVRLFWHTERAASPTGHVVLHLLHFFRRLQRVAARVERDALTHQAEHRRLGCAGRIAGDMPASRGIDAVASART